MADQGTETGPTTSTQATVVPDGHTFDAFLSYSHQDSEAARGLQRGLSAIGRRFGQLRALRVFRDSTDLTASPDLWAKVAAAMDASRYLVVVLSPKAAESPWVDRELSYWLERRGPDRLFIVVAAGTLEWDDDEGRFDPVRSSAAPSLLTRPGILPAEPSYVDISEDAPWDFRAPGFRERVIDLAAPIQGKEKSALAGEDLRQQRRERRVRRIAVATLAILTVLAVGAGITAWLQAGEARLQRDEAQRQRDQAVAQSFVSESQALVDDNPAIALAFAAQAQQSNSVEPARAARAEWQARVAAGSSAANLVGRPLTGHEEGVLSVAFSPDGTLLASAGWEGTVRFWDAKTGEPAGEPLVADEYYVESVAFSPDGTRLATAGSTVRMWDADTKEPIGEPLVDYSGDEESGGASTVAFSPDGSVLAAATSEGVRLWDARTGQPIGDSLRGTDSVLTTLAFSPDGRMLAVGGGDGSVSLWSPTSGAPIGELVPGGTERIVSLAFSPDSTILVTAEVYQLRRWHADTGAPIGEPILVDDQLNFVTFSPDGTRLACGLSDGSVRLWDAGTGLLLGEPLIRHTDWVYSVAFSPDGTRLASASGDGTVGLWDPGDGHLLGEPLLVQEEQMYSVTFGADGAVLASIDYDANVRLWDVDTGDPLGEPFTVAGGGSEVALSPDGKILASAGDDGMVRFWDPRTGDQIRLPVTVPGGVWTVAFSPEGTLAIGGYGASWLWDIAAASQIGPPLTSHDNWVTSMTFSSDGETLASAGMDNTIQLWNTRTGDPMGEPIAVFNGGDSVALQPGGSTLASDGSEGTILLFDVASGDPLGEPLEGNDGDVASLVFSPDGALLVSVSYDRNYGTAQLWDPSTGDPVGEPLEGHDEQVNSVAFSPRGDLFATASNDGTVRLWPTRWLTSDVCALTESLVAVADFEWLPSGDLTPVCDYGEWPGD